MSVGIHRPSENIRRRVEHRKSHDPLASYPMEHSHKDAMTSLAGSREAMTREKRMLGRATAMSDVLWRYSKRLFDEAIEGASRAGSSTSGGGDSSLPAITSARAGRPSYSQSATAVRRPVVTSSGPSYYGSPIYNRRPKLLSDIRLRSQTGSRQAAETSEGGVRNDIRAILQESNAKYRVVPSSTGSAMSKEYWQSIASGYPEYLLVLKESDADEQRDDMRTSDTTRAERREPVDAPPAGDQSSGALDSCQSQVDPESCPEADPDDGQVAAVDKLNDALPAERSPQGDINSSSISSNLRSRYRRVTWVDDVTVSSPEAASIPEPGLDAADRCAGAEPPAAPLCAQRVVNLNDLQANSWSLPDFICPTSEDKSKEARMADWLQSTNFTSARRTVPLL